MRPIYRLYPVVTGRTPVFLMYILHGLAKAGPVRYTGERGGEAMASFTRRALQQTLLTLLETMSLDKITVKGIVDTCGISRNTFYTKIQ